MLFPLMLCLAFLVSAFSINTSYKKEGLYSTNFFFLLGAIVYFLAIPAELILKGMDGYSISSVFVVKADTIVYYKIYLMGVMAIFGFTLGFSASGFTTRSPDLLSQDIIKDKKIYYGLNLIELSMLALWLTLILFLVVFFHKFLGEITISYTSSYKLQHDNPLPSFIIGIISLLTPIIAVLLVIKKKLFGVLIGILLFAANILMAIFIYKKGPAIASLLGVGYCYFYLMKNKKLALFLAVAGVCLFIFWIANLFHGFFQTTLQTPEILLHELWRNFQVTFIYIDPSGPMAVTVAAVKANAPLLWGKSYIDGLSLFVPRFLWANRPLDIAQAFGKATMPNWQPGQGMGFGPIAEGYINFGFWGSGITFIIFGLLWGWTWRGFRKLVDGHNFPLHFDIIYRVIGFYMMIQFFRGFTLGTFKPLIMAIIPLACAIIGMKILLKIIQIKRKQTQL